MGYAIKIDSKITERTSRRYKIKQYAKPVGYEELKGLIRNLQRMKIVFEQLKKTWNTEHF